MKVTMFVVSLLCMLIVLISASIEEKSKAMFEAVRSNKPAIVESLIRQEDRLLNTPGLGGQTPLMAAVLTGSYDVVDILLRLGADATIGEADGYTPMHGAGFQGNNYPLEVASPISSY
jgi:ankyrin repeat protein